jgi:polysaccharide deacetylase family protein (PEP-CTERM system associated)
VNRLTIDLEDWHQLTGWVMKLPSDPRPAALERQTVRLLDLLARHQCRATFFCLGRSLAHCAHVVRRIADAGHEIASHGWNHERICQTGLPAFRQDLLKSLDWLSSITGRPVAGYRAPCFSVTKGQLQGFLEICREAGLRYDSSIYPFRGRHYGIADAPRAPYRAHTNGGQPVVEFPLLTAEWLGRRWPIAGGGSWRILPTTLIDSAIRRYNSLGWPAVLYFHPYEFDPEVLNVSEAVGPSMRSSLWTAHQNLGRQSIHDKLSYFLNRYRFGALEDALADMTA